MNIRNTNLTAKVTLATAEAFNAAEANDAAQSNEAAVEETTPQDSTTFTIELPSSFDVDITKYVKYATRVIPGTMSLALNAPNVLASPILNAGSPATTSQGQLTKERWANVIGSSAIGAAVGGVAMGGFGGAFVGSLIGGAVGGARIGIGAMFGKSQPKYPEVGDAAYIAKRGYSSSAHGTGAALRTGYATAVKEAYMDGGKYADSTVDFARGLMGMSEK